MKKASLVFIAAVSLISGAFLYFNLENEKINLTSEYAEETNINSRRSDISERKIAAKTLASEFTRPKPLLKMEVGLKDDLSKKSNSGNLSSPNSVSYEVEEDGLVTVDGDIVLGAANEGSVMMGRADAAELQLWSDAKVPFFIQGDLEHPELVIKALAMFVDTPIQFLPYQGEEDVLVFQAASAGCKSYLGKIGGKQPIWISPGCGVSEIAHEIMHALGFIHEQNRTDRDGYVDIRWEDIIESKKINFELFPFSLMKVSGKAQFDFKSIMLYPPTTFTKNGRPTILPIDANNEIAPSHGTLSSGDLLRLSAAYSK